MKNKRAIIILLVIFLFLMINGCTSPELQKNSQNAIENKKLNTVATGSTQMNDVLIELTPAGMKDGKFVVNLVANTHSVDLGRFDLMQLTTLEYNENQIKPSSAPALSGHHTSGELIFNIGKLPENFKIIINGIPNIEERVFEWA